MNLLRRSHRTCPLIDQANPELGRDRWQQNQL
jgi:hypothetical protein